MCVRFHAHKMREASLSSLGNLIASITEVPATFLGSHHRWVSLAVGVCMQLCAGTLYSITAWGVPLKEAAGWEKEESLNLAETCGTLGVYVAIHNGLLVDRVGARSTLLLGKVEGATFGSEVRATRKQHRVRCRERDPRDDTE